MSGLLEASDSPRITIESGERSYTQVFKCDHGTAEDHIPADGSASTYGYFRKAEIQSAPGYDTLLLTYDSEKITAGGTSMRRNNETVWTAHAGTFEKPLEMKTGYKTIWNYTLWATFKSAPVYTGYNTQTTIIVPTLVPPDIAENYQWAKTCPGEGWYAIAAATKPGQESFLVHSLVVVKQQYFRRKVKAEAVLVGVGKRSTPTEVFGVVGGEWLITDCFLREEGKFWVTTTEYTWADSFDHDLYDELT